MPDGVDYEAFDGSLANLIFMIAAPEEGRMFIWSAVPSVNASHGPLILKRFNPCGVKRGILQLIDDKESERYEKKRRAKRKPKASDAHRQSMRLRNPAAPVTVFSL